ncbi:translesion error-prone DNA polymerase V autoproteolytic subunit [Leucobacter alluvii]|uniref:Translesion error-prone DNA polymerase V autoproteolytic subunit n=1 Tax=Leucobacter alluvii TaxID=340321 RepID=A0ABN3B2J0_9MICO
MRVEDVRILGPNAPAVAIPIASVEAACGFPSPAQDYETTEIDLNEHLMPNRVSTFLIRARGNSMTSAGIYDGDELIVDRSIRPEDGHVVVAVVDGEMTVKRLRVTRVGVVLSAENYQHPDIEVAELSELHIWGVVTRSLHRVLRA